MSRYFLLRYDTEAADPAKPQQMDGFFEKAVEIHRKHAIPATFFCCGRALDLREKSFRQFFAEVKDDPLVFPVRCNVEGAPIRPDRVFPMHVVFRIRRRHIGRIHRIKRIGHIGVYRCSIALDLPVSRHLDSRPEQRIVAILLQKRRGRLFQRRRILKVPCAVQRLEPG